MRGEVPVVSPRAAVRDLVDADELFVVLVTRVAAIGQAHMHVDATAPTLASVRVDEEVLVAAPWVVLHEGDAVFDAVLSERLELVEPTNAPRANIEDTL